MSTSQRQGKPFRSLPRRALLLLGLFAVCGCARRDEAVVSREAARSSQSTSQPSAAVVHPPRFALELPELERARLDYLFAAAELVALDWPQLVAAETCILLVAERVQWVVNCADAPTGFVALAARYRERTVFAHAADSFQVSGELRTTQQLLSRTPAAAHVLSVAARDSGLPAGHAWLLLGTLEALRAFHPAFGPATTESWLSVAMHELVHIHQLRTPAFAPYREQIERAELDPSRLTAAYASDPDLHAQIEREYTQLVAAAQSARSASAARRALRVWLDSYQRRSRRLAAQPGAAALLQEERIFTYLEGVARYVESDFLANAAQHPSLSLENDPQFSNFAAFMGHGYAASPNRQLDTQYYYALGYHLCVLLDRVDATWRKRVDSQPGWLIGLLERSARH